MTVDAAFVEETFRARLGGLPEPALAAALGGYENARAWGRDWTLRDAPGYRIVFCRLARWDRPTALFCGATAEGGLIAFGVEAARLSAAIGEEVGPEGARWPRLTAAAALDDGGVRLIDAGARWSEWVPTSTRARWFATEAEAAAGQLAKATIDAPAAWLADAFEGRTRVVDAAGAAFVQQLAAERRRQRVRTKDLPRFVEIRDLLSRAFTADEMARSRERTQQLAAALDPEPLRIAHRLRLHDGRSYDWIAGERRDDEPLVEPGADAEAWDEEDEENEENEDAPPVPGRIGRALDPVLALRRRQALAAYPAFVERLMTPEITAVIDAGAPLERVLAGAMQTSRATIRGLRLVRCPMLGRSPSFDVDEALPWLDQTPRAWWPRSRVAWRAFCAAHREMDEAVAPGFFLAGRAKAEIVRETRGDWAALGRLIADARISDVSKAVWDILTILAVPALDAFERSAEAALGEPVPDGLLMFAPARVVLGRRGFRRALEWARRWRRSPFKARWGGAPWAAWEGWDAPGWAAGACWSPLLESVSLGRGFVAREIASAEALGEDGRRQRHCVVKRLPKVIEGRAIVFSIARDGAPVSTIALAPPQDDAGGGRWALIEHRAARNGEPDAETREAGKNLLAALRALEPARLGAYREALRAVERETTSRRAAAGAPLSSAEQEVRTRFEALRGFLPPEARKLDVEAWTVWLVQETVREMRGAAERGDPILGGFALR